jgi:hypothetical protein
MPGRGRVPPARRCMGARRCLAEYGLWGRGFASRSMVYGAGEWEAGALNL